MIETSRNGAIVALSELVDPVRRNSTSWFQQLEAFHDPSGTARSGGRVAQLAAATAGLCSDIRKSVSSV
jgi:hypothetical protein